MFESDVSREIRESVRKLAEKEIPQFQNEEHYGTVPRKIYQHFASLGLTGLTLAEENGGLGLGAMECAAALEEISAVDMGPAIFLSVHLMVAKLLEKFFFGAARAELLGKMADGTYLGAFALTESNAGSDAANLKTTARRDGSNYILNGSKCWITSAGYADLYLVFARTSGDSGKDGISAFVVYGDNPGLIPGKPEKKMGCELSPISTISFENCVVPEADRVGEDGHGYRIALGGLAGGRVNIGACALGLARTALKKSTAHLNEREQFGQPLIQFQGLQFMLADMMTQYDAAQLLVQRAAATLDQNPGAPENRLYPSMAKCFATDAAMKITTDAVQLLGGAGYVQEYGVERLMRDAKMLQIVEGTNQIQRMVIARSVIG